MESKTGFILINKPSGITSHNVVDYLRKITGIKKIGHSGTLDPLATGLLILGIGRGATKLLYKFLNEKKEYIAKIRLGATSTTYDREGEIVFKKNVKIPTRQEIKNVLKRFCGKIKQIPPRFSAKKIKGKKMYELARKGEKVELKPIKVEIYKIYLLKYKWPFLEIKVNCSSGTYIRSLANDIGKELNCGGYIEELARIRIGKICLNEAVDLYKLNSQNWEKFLIDISKIL
ncbi:tRNA pseudouridine(55) synthase TruB [bacterium]|nr:tRNA pseudouridine(55) synthase TruB [bacterium]